MNCSPPRFDTSLTDCSKFDFLQNFKCFYNKVKHRKSLLHVADGVIDTINSKLKMTRKVRKY